MDNEKLPDTPIIMTFALSPEEWAMVAAALEFLVEQADLIAQTKGGGKPPEVQGILDTASMFSRLIHNEMVKVL